MKSKFVAKIYFQILKMFEILIRFFFAYICTIVHIVRCGDQERIIVGWHHGKKLIIQCENIETCLLIFRIKYNCKYLCSTDFQYFFFIFYSNTI